MIFELFSLKILDVLGWLFGVIVVYCFWFCLGVRKNKSKVCYKLNVW